MTKYSWLLMIFILLLGCRMNNEDDDTKTFLIVDRSSNKVLNNYEYDRDDDTLVRTQSYNQNEQVKKIIEYQYDDDGNLAKTIESSIGSPSKIVTYKTENVFDDDGRLTQTIRTSSDGELVETYFGYDENGDLRGVVEQVNKGAVIMKDYKNY